MRTETINVYTYEELSPEAQKRAREWYRSVGGDFWDHYGKDALASLEAFCGRLCLRVRSYSIGGMRGDYVTVEDTFSGERIHRGTTTADTYGGCLPLGISGQRLWRYLENNYNITSLEECPFTGVIYDESILGPMRKFMAKPTHDETLNSLLLRCIDSWMRDVVKELEYQDSDEGIIENLTAGEYEFTEYGNYHIPPRCSVDHTRT